MRNSLLYERTVRTLNPQKLATASTDSKKSLMSLNTFCKITQDISHTFYVHWVEWAIKKSLFKCFMVAMLNIKFSLFRFQKFHSCLSRMKANKTFMDVRAINYLVTSPSWLWDFWRFFKHFCKNLPVFGPALLINLFQNFVYKLLS